jgi:hypothetical protein
MQSFRFPFPKETTESYGGVIGTLLAGLLLIGFGIHSLASRDWLYVAIELSFSFSIFILFSEIKRKQSCSSCWEKSRDASKNPEFEAYWSLFGL